MEGLIRSLGEEVEDVDEETFLLFSTPIPSSNLGFLSSTSPSLSITVASTDYTIHQSPGLLASDAPAGTTGAVLWKITPLVADWLLDPSNVLFRSGTLTPASHVVELGAGIGGLLAMSVGARAKLGRWVATDLDYVLKGLRRNLGANGVEGFDDAPPEHSARARRGHFKSGPDPAPASTKRKRGGASKATDRAGKEAGGAGPVSTLELDWTASTPRYLRDGLPDPDAVDVVLACDCVYNEALVEPFVQTCLDLCGLRRFKEESGGDGGPRPTVCVVAQQLRSDLVFEAWLRQFMRYFRVWRVPDELLIEGLKEGNGYVLHIGVLESNKSGD